MHDFLKYFRWYGYTIFLVLKKKKNVFKPKIKAEANYGGKNQGSV